MYELAVVVGADVVGLVVDNADVVAVVTRMLAFGAVVVVVGAVVVAVRCLAFDVAVVGVVVVVAGDLRWLWLRHRGRIAVFYS